MPAEVAITWSDLGRAMLQTEPLGQNQTHPIRFLDTISTWHRSVLDAGLHRDVRFEGASLDGLKLLITPAMPYVSPEFLQRVEHMVRAGGVWICAPVTGTRTQEHTVPTDAGLGSVEALAGIETVVSFPVTGTGATGEAFGLSAPLAGWCSGLRVRHPDTRAVGGLHTTLTREPLAFLTERALGRGAIVVLAAMPQGESGAELLRKLVWHYAERAGVTVRSDATFGTVVCPWVEQDGKPFWIAVNMDGRGGEVRLARGAAVKLKAYEWRVLRA